MLLACARDATTKKMQQAGLTSESMLWFLVRVAWLHFMKSESLIKCQQTMRQTHMVNSTTIWFLEQTEQTSTFSNISVKTVATLHQDSDQKRLARIMISEECNLAPAKAMAWRVWRATSHLAGWIHESNLPIIVCVYEHRESSKISKKVAFLRRPLLCNQWSWVRFISMLVKLNAFSLLALKNCESQTWRQPTSACESRTWRWQKFTESGTFCSEDDWSCEKNSIYPSVLYQDTRIYIIIMSYKDTWDGPCANQNNLRLVLDVSAVLHGSFPPSDGHLQLWSMGDNIVDPFGALIADGQWGNQMGTKLLVDCLDLYSFPTLDENCLYNPL